jgi:hypothetical protein
MNEQTSLPRAFFNSKTFQVTLKRRDGTTLAYNMKHQFRVELSEDENACFTAAIQTPNTWIEAH